MNKTNKLLETLRTDTFPEDANVRISITGLALCRLSTETSAIKFPSHAPLHELFIYVLRKRRNTSPPILLFDSKIVLGQRISIESNRPVPFGSIKAPVGTGEFPLKEILNLPVLHGKAVTPATPPLEPILLSLKDCAFYTKEMISESDTLELVETVDEWEGPILKPRFGRTIGGKMKCDTGGETVITITGISNYRINLPQNPDFVYDIIFTNHCTNKEECEDLMEHDSDFRYYYHLLKDPDNPARKFKIKIPKGAPTIEVGACVVAIEDPPIDS